MKDKNGLYNMIKTTCLPIAIYYLVHQMAAVFLLGMLKKAGWEDGGNLWSMCAKMLAMVIAGLGAYPFYHKTEKGMGLTVRNTVLILVAGAVVSLGLNYLFSITGLT